MSGGQNSLLGKFLWPDRSPEDQARFGVEKEDLFRTVALDGALPRKTFSMGEASEKRFYLEGRRRV